MEVTNLTLVNLLSELLDVIKSTFEKSGAKIKITNIIYEQ